MFHPTFFLLAAGKYGHEIKGNVAVWRPAGHTYRQVAEVKHRSDPALTPYTIRSVLAAGAPAKDKIAEVPHTNEKGTDNGRYSLSGFTQVIMSEARGKNEHAETDYSQDQDQATFVSVTAHG